MARIFVVDAPPWKEELLRHLSVARVALPQTLAGGEDQHLGSPGEGLKEKLYWFWQAK